MNSERMRLERILVEILREVNRPLSVRRLKTLIGEREPMSEPDVPLLEDVLSAAIQNGVVIELRHGVYAVSDARDNDANRGQRYERRRRRRSRLAQASDGFPAAPLSLDETAAMSVQADDPAQLQMAIWMRLSRKAAEAAGLSDEAVDYEGLESIQMGELDEAVGGKETAGYVEPLADFIRTTVQDGGGRMRVKSRRGPFQTQEEDEGSDEWTGENAYPQVRYSDGVDGEPESWGSTLESAANSVVGGRAPFRDARRDEREFIGEDRRGRKSDTIGTETLLTAVARKALEADGRRRTIADLDDLVVATAGLEGGELRARIISENERKRRSGNRPVFVLDSDGKVGLTDWDLPGRYEAHEKNLKRAELELREIVKRALLERVASQNHRVFRRLMFMLLERLNFADIREFRTIGDKRLALVARRTSGVDDDETAIIVDGSWAPIDTGTIETLRDNLEYFEAAAGLVITIGTFTERAVESASDPDYKRIRLLDGASLAAVLADHGLGIQNYRIRIPYVDGGFFSALGQ